MESFFQVLLDFVLQFFFNFANIILTVVISPFLIIVWALFPDFNLLTLSENFLTQIINGVGFAKEVFLNLTGLPRTIFYVVILYFFGRWTATAMFRSFRFILNIIHMIRGK